MTIYYSPEKYGLRVLAAVDWREEPYEFEMTVLWSDNYGNYFIASDSGCSCPCPFEDYDITTLTKVSGLTDLVSYLDQRIENIWGAVTAQDGKAKIVNAYVEDRDGVKIGSYRKKPVEILAVQFNGYNGREVAKWCGGRYTTNFGEHELDVYETVIIPTLEGNMIANVGDYIIRGVQGEFYPCKPDIFEQTYERSQ